MYRPARGALAARAPPSLLPPLPALPPPSSSSSSPRGKRQAGREAQLAARRGDGAGEGARRGSFGLQGPDRAGGDTGLGPARPRAHPLSQAGSALVIPGGAHAPFPSQGLGSLGLRAPDCGSRLGTAGPRVGWAALRALRCRSDASLQTGRSKRPARRPHPRGKPTPGRRGLRGGAAAAVGPGRPGLTRLRGRSAPGPGEARSGSGKADQIHTSQATGRSEEVFLLDTGWNRKGSPDRSEWELLCPKATPSQSAGSPRPGHRLRWARGSGLPLLPSAVT